MTDHIRPASFATLDHDNIPKGTPISFQYANAAGDDWSEIRGTLSQSMLIGRDETGRMMPTEDARLRDATGIREIECGRIMDFLTLEDEDDR